MSKQSGPNNRNRESNLFSHPVNIQRKPTGFFDIPQAPQNEARSAPSHFDMTQVKNSLTDNANDDHTELDEHWFTLPSIDDAPFPRKACEGDPSPLIDIIKGFVQGLESLQALNESLSSSADKTATTTSSRSSSSSTNSQADDKTLVFNKKGSKAEIIATMKIKIEVLLVKNEREPDNFSNLTLVNELEIIFKEALACLKKRIEIHKQTTNLIKARIEGFLEELKPFKTPSSAPTSARSSYRR